MTGELALRAGVVNDLAARVGRIWPQLELRVPPRAAAALAGTVLTAADTRWPPGPTATAGRGGEPVRPISRPERWMARMALLQAAARSGQGPAGGGFDAAHPGDRRPGAGWEERQALRGRGRRVGGRFAPTPTGADAQVLLAAATVDPLVRERLLGALELPVADLAPEPVPEVAALFTPSSRRGPLLLTRGEGAALASIRVLGARCPGCLGVVRDLARVVAGHPYLTGRLAGGTSAGPALAAPGVRALTLAVATAAICLRGLTEPRSPQRPEDAAGVVGAGIGIAVLVLRDGPVTAR